MICPECHGRGETIYYVETARDENSVTVVQRKGTCRTCNGSGEKVQSNADRIRAMSDEQLAKLFMDFAVKCYDDCGVSAEIITTDYVMEWLKQPTEGE